MSNVPLQPPHPLTDSPWTGLSKHQVRKELKCVAGLVQKIAARPDESILWHGGGVEDSRAIAVAAFMAGVGALLGRMVEQNQLHVNHELGFLLTQQLARSRNRARRLREAATDVLAEFECAGLQPILLKGIHTAYHCFEEPGIRPMSDIDLLVPACDFDRASQTLCRFGFVPMHVSVGRATSFQLNGASHDVVCLESEHPENPWTIDLHQSIDCRVHRGLRTRFRSLPFDCTRPASMFGHDVLVFEPMLQLLHLAVHSSYHIPSIRLMRILEIAIVIKQFKQSDEMDWPRLWTLAKQSNCHRLSYPGFELAERLLPGLLSSEFRQKMARTATLKIRRVVELAMSAGFDGWALSGNRIDHRFVWNDGLRDWLYSLLEIAWPSSIQARDYWTVQSRRIRLIASWVKHRRAA